MGTSPRDITSRLERLRWCKTPECSLHLLLKNSWKTLVTLAGRYRHVEQKQRVVNPLSHVLEKCTHTHTRRDRQTQTQPTQPHPPTQLVLTLSLALDLPKAPVAVFTRSPNCPKQGFLQRLHSCVGLDRPCNLKALAATHLAAQTLFFCKSAKCRQKEAATGVDGTSTCNF